MQVTARLRGFSMKRIMMFVVGFLAVTVPASAQIDFSDGTSLNTGSLTNVIVVQAEGTDTENGTALKDVMDGISVSNTTRIVIQLAAGTYDLGGNTLAMRPFVMLRGVGREYSVVTGTGGVLVEGASSAVLRDVQLYTATSSTILLRIQNGAYVDTFRAAFIIESTGGVTVTGIQILSGGELDINSGAIGGDTSNAGGTITGLSVSGTDSSAFLFNTIIDLVELSSGSVTGISTGTGATVEIVTGESILEREVSGDDVTALSIGSGSRAILKNTSMLARVNGISIGILTIDIPTTGGLLVFGSIM